MVAIPTSSHSEHKIPSIQPLNFNLDVNNQELNSNVYVVKVNQNWRN